MAALLTIEAANTDKLAMYLGECRDLGIPILPPDVNSSELAFTVARDGVRFGLCAIKNVGEGAVLSMLASGKTFGRIDSLLYALRARRSPAGQQAGARKPHQGRRARLDGVRTAIAACGTAAPASLPPSTRRIEHGGRHQRDRDKGQSQLFGGCRDDDRRRTLPLPDAPPWTEAQQLAFEKEALGLYMSGHPLERFADELKVFGASGVGELAASEADVWVGGIVSGLRPLKTKKGDRMCVFMLDDIAGSLEVVVFPETFGKHGALVEADAMLLVRGKFEKDDESARIVATELQPIAALKERTTREVVIHLSGRSARPQHLRGAGRAVDAASRRPPCVPRARREKPGTPLRVRSEVAQRVRPSERLVTEVEQICGAGSVELR